MIRFFGCIVSKTDSKTLFGSDQVRRSHQSQRATLDPEHGRLERESSRVAPTTVGNGIRGGP